MRKRVVEHIWTDLFVDAAFAYVLWDKHLDSVRRQAEYYAKLGDDGTAGATFRKYLNDALEFVEKRLSGVYRNISRELERRYPDGRSLGEVKAWRAWKAALVLSLSSALSGQSLPQNALEPTGALLREFVEAKASGTKNVQQALKKAVEKIGGEKLAEAAPSLWLFNMVMEPEVLERVLCYQYVIRTKGLHIRSAVESIDSAVAEIEGLEEDAEYTEEEILRAVLARCVELRGQYINKLHSSILFIKALRPGLQRCGRDPYRWGWFLRGDPLTYFAMLHLTELQRLLGVERPLLRIDKLLELKQGELSSKASVVASLIVLSPIYLQYSLERQAINGAGQVAPPATPADVLIALLRLSQDPVRVDDVADEVMNFWREGGVNVVLNEWAGLCGAELKLSRESIRNAVVEVAGLLSSAGLVSLVSYESKHDTISVGNTDTLRRVLRVAVGR